MKEVYKAASGLGIAIAKTIVRDLQAFPEADQRGTVVNRIKNETASNTKARADIEMLFREIIENDLELAANE